MQERLQKIISRAGITSRRAGEELILAGRVRVNGRVVTELGVKADARDDRIEVDGQRLFASAPMYVVLHKPRNVVSTLSDPEGRPTVADYLKPTGERLYPVGRLDFATSGVLLATNDGDFSNALLHPRGGVPKTYVVKVAGLMREADLERWANGVRLDDGPTRPADLHFLRHEEDKTWFEITIREGRNQQIRRMGEATGFPVRRLARLSFAGITSEGLRPGEYRSLTPDELLALREQYGVPKRIRSATVAPSPERPGKHRAPRADRAPRGDRATGSTPTFERPPYRGSKAAAPPADRGERPERGERPAPRAGFDRAERPVLGPTRDRSERPATRGPSPDRSERPASRSSGGFGRAERSLSRKEEAPRPQGRGAPRPPRSDGARPAPPGGRAPRRRGRGA
jgi:23S rRNA pseudouridine2605 synthase